MGTTTIKKHFTRLALEKRIMFDAAALDTAFEALPSSGGVNTEATEASPTDINNVVAALTDLSQEDAHRSVYFIDDSLPDQSVLTAAIPADATIITLATDQNGLVQIADSLQGLTNIEAIHIIAHATDGSLQLGNSIIDAASITDLYAEQLASINQSLAEGADILFYGCDFASTESGIETLQALATSLGADLAASDDITGISGDWDLEQQTGIIEAATFAAENWNHNLLILPVAVDDIAIVEEDSTNILDVTANDINPLEPDPITITSAVAGQGTVEINPDNTLTYTPNANFFGADVITYTISDPDGAALVPGIVAVTVNPVDDLPSLVLPVSIPLFLEDTALVFADVLGTQISLGDLDGGVAVVSLSVPIGDLSLAQTVGLTLSQGDGVNDNEITMEGDIADLNAALNGLIYTPDADYNGPVTITIGITDTLLSLPITATLPLSISAVADIVDDNVSTIIDTPVAFNVMDNDTFENATAIVTSYTTPLHGTITVDAQGQALYTPDSGYTGTDSFTYTVSSNGTTETATVTLTSSLPNTPPTIDVPGTQNSDEDTNLVFSTATSNAITIGDDEASSLTVTLQSTQGVMTLGQTTGISFTTGDGDSDSDIVMSGSITDINAALDGLTYTPTADYYGAATVTVQASDGEASQTSSINVLMVGDIDGVTDDITTDVQTPISFFPLANDTYENTPSLTSVSAGSHGTAVIGVGSSITYTPDAGYRGDDSFTYTVESGGTTEVITVDVTVGINNAPTSTDLVALSLVDNQLVSLSTSLSFSDTDLFDVLTYSATGLPSGLSIDPTTGIILGTVDAHASVLTPDGRYDVVVTATDIAGLSADANLQIQVINPDPIVSAGVATGLEDSDLNLDVLLNASDPDGDALSVDAASALNGTVSINPDGSLTYVPNADFFGIDTLTYTVVDEDGGSATGTITVTVENVLDLPTISIPTLDLFTEDTPLIFADLLGQQISIGDIDGELLDIRLSVPVGTLTLNETAGVSLSEGDGIDDSIVRLSGNVADINVALNNLVYTPGADYNGPVQITVELGQLGQLLLVNAQVPLGIEAVADIVDDTISATEDIPVNFNVLDNDSFENAGRIVDSYTTPSFGTVIIDAQGNATYTPGTSFTGTDSFTYTVLSNGTYETATVTINVNPPANADPTSSAVGNQTANDGELFSLNISGNFADADGDTLTYSASGLPTGLTLDAATGIISGTLGSSASTQIANGEYGITITANDGNGGLVSESFSLTISNPAPTAVADSFSGDEDDNITGNVLLNDSDSDGDSLSVNTSPIVAPLHGSLTLNGDGSFVYIPDPNYNGNDTFTYQVIDADGGTANAVVSLTVNAVNDTPIATGESATTDEDTPVTVDVLANDTDADGDSLSVDSATATNGTVAINPDGTITYTPDANFTGSDTITYTVSDGNGGTSTATVAVTINAVNDNPTTTGESATTDEDTPVTVDVLANDSDVDGDTLSVDSATAANGTVAINPDGTITYTPNANFTGSDTITYTVSDGNGGTSSAIVNVTVDPINDAPTTAGESATTDEDTPVTVDVLANDSDVDGDTLTVDSATAGNGTVAINPDGTITYTPNANFTGSDTITYTVTDGNGGTATATVAVTINAVNDSPSTAGESATTDEDTPVTIDVLANDSDVDGDTLTVDSASAANGTVAINPDGTITYTPDANFTGSDTITYTVTDGNGGTATATVAVTINSVNDS
ncbi:Ig-like domain-containing protein, partial [Neptunomonas phycophila]|uniref:Ig-like domain-containing protein n=1 Tax=Neptunomonas phycophila TaxID=1572645 RepID=UPI0030F80254